MILLIFAFLSGLVTILAPCIWPILPVVLSSSAVGGKLKPIGITFGVMLSFAFFTLSLSYIVKIIPFDPNLLRLLSAIVIGLLGFSLVIPRLSAILEGLVSKLNSSFANRLPKGNGFLGGFITGFSLGIIWSPCAGPILATIAALAATRAINLQIILVTLAYVLGIGLPLFIFASLGNLVLSKVSFFSKYTARIQQIFGLIMILTAVLIYTNYDKVLQSKLLNLFPAYSGLINNFESNQAVTSQLNLLKGSNFSGLNLGNQGFGNSLSVLGKAPEFVGINKWLNLPADRPALSMKELQGKVVLVDFWTYTCINCIRTLPYVTSWYDKYKDEGLVVVGVHTPEFEFEKNTDNVLNAIKQFNIHYPVAQDNNYSTWQAYNNEYWPAEYLIDAKGNIRAAHFGEGDYDKSEEEIKQLLKEAGQNVDEKMVTVNAQTPSESSSPETYLGYKRIERFNSPEKIVPDGENNYSYGQNLPKDYFEYGGKWIVGSERAMPNVGSTLQFNFTAKEVYLVMRPKAGVVGKVRVYQDGKVVGEVSVDKDKLYTLASLPKVENHLLKLEFLDNNLEVYAFTFG